MGKTQRYLKVSDTGFWGYRRVVPKHLREIIRKREWKKAYKTKDKTTAFKLHAEYHHEVDFGKTMMERTSCKLWAKYDVWNRY